MAEIIIPILRIASILCTCNGNNTWYLCDLQENKNALDIAMEELKDKRDDVKRRVVEAENNPNEPMECNKEVSGWLERVQAIEVEVVQVLLKADKEIKGRCFGSYCSINCWSRYKTGKLVTQTLEIVKDFKAKGSFVDVAHKLPPPLVQKKAVELTLGMESMFEKVWRWLADDEVRIMGIYGYGGVGKTTLLKQINNAFDQSTATSSSTHSFDVVILVVVSKVIKMDAIHKVIGDRLGLSSPNEENIYNTLSKKNFLLLLDDIWERVDLQSIGIPPPLENKKSKVIFTTRSETVCGLMEANEMLKVECLPWDKAWNLFQEKVGDTTLNSFPRARELAKEVARECDGLPLALITIGRAMSSRKTVQQWKHAITTLRRSASEFPGMGDVVLPLLKLSYDNLGDAVIKSCFLYCALFPEDESMYIPTLLNYWIGEGLIPLNEFDHIDKARDQGYEVIGILKGASLLEEGEVEEVVKMHDTIRDLALWIAHDCESERDKMFIITTTDLTAETSSWNNAERICVSFIHNGNMKVPVPLSTQNSPKLLTLIYEWTFSPFLIPPQNFFSFMPRLRVLDLSASYIKTFPTSITELPELQYLSISNTYIEELPKELVKLVKLKYLDLSNMYFLRTIPPGVIGSLLLELRVLNTYSCSAVWDFDELYELEHKHLNDFGIDIDTQHNLNKLLSNQSLQMCTTSLHLFSTPSLSPSSSTTTTLGIGNIKSLEKLELLSNLKLLCLDLLPELRNVNMGVWENHYNYIPQEDPFQYLGEIVIRRCHALKDLTWVGYMVNLKHLYLSHCEEMVIIVDDFGGSTTRGGGGDEISMVMNNVEDVFKRLRRLIILDLPKLKSICRNALAFPCLKNLLVSNCPQLKKLPFNTGSNVNNTLQKIGGEQKWWNELRWEEDNDNNELVKSKFLPYFQEYVV